MNRRELLKMIALATGTAFIGEEFLLSGCKNPEAGPSTEFSPETISFLDEVGETILPKTNTPGAKDARIGEYMKIMVNDCYTEDNQKIFHDGIKQLNDECEQMHKISFVKATAEQRKTLLTKLDADAKKTADQNKAFNE